MIFHRKPKIKQTAAYILIAFSLISLIVAARDIGRAFAAKAPDSPSAVSGEPDGNYAVLFRGSSFCPTCDLMEKLSKELLRDPGSSFARGAADGGISFKAVNFEKPGNEHYLFDYDLYTTTIVLIEQREGKQVRWKNLQESWKHAEESGDFKEYLANEIHAFTRGEE